MYKVILMLDNFFLKYEGEGGVKLNPPPNTPKKQTTPKKPSLIGLKFHRKHSTVLLWLCSMMQYLILTFLADWKPSESRPFLEPCAMLMQRQIYLFSLFQKLKADWKNFTSKLFTCSWKLCSSFDKFYNLSQERYLVLTLQKLHKFFISYFYLLF